jgi:hypothetical protein
MRSGLQDILFNWLKQIKTHQQKAFKVIVIALHMDYARWEKTFHSHHVHKNPISMEIA